MDKGIYVDFGAWREDILAQGRFSPSRIVGRVENALVDIAEE